MRTQWGYSFSYRVHFHGDGYAEMSGAVMSPAELSEIELQQLVLDNLDGHKDMPPGVRRDELVITRFGYVSVEPVDIPDLAQDTGQTTSAEDTDKAS